MTVRSDIKVGLLALQGDFARHREALAGLGVQTFGIRRPAELAQVDCLIIPGGESTTLSRLIDQSGLRKSLREFAVTKPVMGTCAGLIMLAGRLAGEQALDFGVQPLGLLDCAVQRNGYGRQVDSFTAKIDTGLLTGDHEPFEAVFIRAPCIVEVGPQAEVVAKHGDQPVAIRQGHLLGLAFHPELTSDARIHRAFLDLVG